MTPQKNVMGENDQSWTRGDRYNCQWPQRQENSWESRIWKAWEREEEGGVRFKRADYGLRLINVVPALLERWRVLQGPRSRLHSST